MAAAMDALAGFRAAIGATRVVTDAATCALYSQDVYRSGVPALAVLQPQDVTDVLALVRAARTSRTASAPINSAPSGCRVLLFKSI